MRILIVEDSAPVAGALRWMLDARKYAVDVVHDGETGLEYLLRDVYDAAILDIGLPRRDGFDIARQARAQGIETPILMLTARDGVEDRVRGLDIGADDYLVKPFEEEELLARIRTLTRRGHRPISNQLRVGSLLLDTGGRSVSYDGVQLDLGSTEFRLLEFFMRNAGMALSRSQLLGHVWDYDFDGSSNIVDVYVSALRKKLRKAGAAELIQTVWGVGYKLST
jgi:DNA-binding response OmpR family regulator